MATSSSRNMKNYRAKKQGNTPRGNKHQSPLISTGGKNNAKTKASR